MPRADGPLGSVTASTVMPSISLSVSARYTLPTVAPDGSNAPSSTPLGFSAPAARHVHVPSGRALVNSISILRDIELPRYRDPVPIYALGALTPDIHPDAYIHPDAVVIGDVRVGALSSVWPCAVLRGDGGAITVGERTSIQDGSVIHTTPESPTQVGNDCTIGHQVHLEGCVVEDGCLVGNGAIVLHRVIVRSGGMVGANAVVLDGTEVPSGAIAVGIPAVIKPGKARPEMIASSALSYIERAAYYRSALRRLD